MKTDINITPAPGSSNTLTILEGKALELKQPEKINIAGNIDSISGFLNKRYDGRVGKDLQFVDKDKAIVIVDKDAMEITLQLDPQNTFGPVIKGSLELSTELAVFHINESKMFKREEFVNLLRFNRLSFDNKEQHEKILKAYMSFEAKTNTDLAAASDTRGNKAASINKQVTSNIPTDFVLLIPIFKGKGPLRFRVEICLDVTDGGARFWLESTELHELINTERDIIFNEELKSCEDFVIINK
jgi:hypothetical protein